MNGVLIFQENNLGNVKDLPRSVTMANIFQVKT